MPSGPRSGVQSTVKHLHPQVSHLQVIPCCGEKRVAAYVVVQQPRRGSAPLTRRKGLQMPRPADRSQSRDQDVTHPSKAIELFTDRQGAIAAFARHVNAPEGSILPVLHFYGVGGCGKSLLLEKLRQTANEELQPHVPCATVDFHQETQRGTVAALIALKSQFERNFKISFPEFDLIWAVLMEQQGGAEASLFRQFTTGTNMAMAAVEAIAGAPLSAVREGAASLLDAVRKRYPPVEAWLRKVGGTERILELRTYTTEGLLGELVRAFAVEVAANAPARPGCACRAVLFFDTYEKLWENTDGPTSPQGREKDRWIRELYAELLNDNAVLPVIAGRDYLCWPEVDDGWREDRDSGALCTYLDAHILGGLSAQDTQRYLSRCGVGRPPEGGPPEPLQAAIIECSSGGDPDEQGCLPLYLGLCANIVLNERRPEPAGHGADPPPEWFRGIPNDDVAGTLANRFLTSLPSITDRNLVEALSVPRWFDETVLAARLDSQDSASAAWERLEDYSFTENIGEGRLRFHAIMREALQHILAQKGPERLAELHEWFREHWRVRFGEGETDAEVEAWYHYLYLEPEDAFDAWRSEAQQATEQRDGVRGRDLIAWWEGVDITGDQWQARMGDEKWASTVHGLGYWLDELRPFAWMQGEVCIQAIACYESALRVRTEAAYPSDWAMTQNHLGIAYWRLPVGDLAANIRRAIGHWEAALRVYTIDQFPREWANARNWLGVAYSDLPVGDRASNLETAINCHLDAVEVYTEEDLPVEWADVQNDLGVAYSDRPTGDRADNMAKAIECYQAALRVYSEDDFPEDWAKMQTNLGVACWELPNGDRSANLGRAVCHYERALRVYTEDDFPADWAMVQSNLGDAYRDIETGDIGANVARAIGHYQAAMRVYTEAAFPYDWAEIQINLARAYCRLEDGDRSTNLARAISCCEAALKVFRRDVHPMGWAAAQHVLGSIHSLVPGGHPGKALVRALVCYEAALGVRTEEDLPMEWAETQNSMGEAHEHLVAAKDGRHFHGAITCYQAALRVRTEAAFPRDWADTMCNLAGAYRRQGDHQRAAELLHQVAESQFADSWAIYSLACELALAGDPDAAYARLRQACELDGEKYRPIARDDDDFVSLRDDPRFAALIADTP